jgi:hypothetical protein
LLQDVEELMEHRRIETNGDSEMAWLAKDQFERGRGREDLMIG